MNKATRSMYLHYINTIKSLLCKKHRRAKPQEVDHCPTPVFFTMISSDSTVTVTVVGRSMTTFQTRQVSVPILFQHWLLWSSFAFAAVVQLVNCWYLYSKLISLQG